ncbi:glycosyltransferase family 4 protein [Candidatus Woesearchaeota archaeon]|nr:glycosyltransferase family 4 protein [Candidatus Woesearchaeota archaeon]MCF7901534.1 glycosyltransferase family 4 protein [Candidatus Woesearchaeota archaeon]MCF8013878.1 glycosyltransferase family 4 protein [Candidatus Woesearchaeota archaeon]
MINEKKKLLIATDNFLPRWDGIARFLKEIMPELIKNFEVSVLCPDFGKIEAEGYKIKKIPLSKIKLGDYNSAKLDRTIIKNEIKKNDIVFTQTIGLIGATAIYYAKKYRKPTASYIHNLEWELVPMATKNLFLRRLVYPLMKIYVKYIYKKSHTLIAPSEGISELLSWQGIPTKKKIVRLGVNQETFKPLKEKTEKEQKEIQELKQKLKLEGFFIIGNHGRIAEEKDLGTLIRAFSWLQKKHEDIKLIIIGDGIQEIKDRIQKSKNTILIPRTNEPEKYLNLMDVYVTTSLTETTSLATVEAMASGIPVIATKVGYMKEYIQNNENGFLINIKDNYELYKKIELLKANKDLARKIGNKGKTTATKLFNWDTTANEIATILNELE